MRCNFKKLYFPNDSAVKTDKNIQHWAYQHYWYFRVLLLNIKNGKIDSFPLTNIIANHLNIKRLSEQ